MKPRLMHSAIALFTTSAALWGTPMPAAAQQVRYYHLDAIGNVRAITDAAGNVVERHDYLPFGEECTTGPCASNPGVGAGQPLKFTGKERDTETGLDYFGARYYGSKIGRFTTVDPFLDLKSALVEPQKWNRYSYVTNNPLRYTDPDGRERVGQILDQDARAVLGGHMSVAEYNARIEARGVGALVGVSLLVPDPSDALLGAAVGRVLGATRIGRRLLGKADEALDAASDVRNLSANAQRRIRGLENQVREHEQKLADYVKNPDAHDNLGFLKNAPDAATRQKIIDSRVRSLEHQIETFKKDVEVLKRGADGAN